MISFRSHLARSRARRFAAIGGCLLAILGFKFLLIGRLASPTPFWDQWAEAAGVYLPYLSHRLTFDHFIAFHNEHRLLLTRATALALLILDGEWDARVQMLVGALVHVAAIGLLLVGLGAVLDFKRLLFLLAFSLLFFAVPFGWDNALSGFQIQFYFLLLLSVMSLVSLSRASAWSPEWLLGTALAVLGYFSVASGALILPAAIAIALVQIGLRQRVGIGELVGVALQAIIAFALIHDVTTNAPHTAIIDASFRQLFSSLMISASWPVAARSWPVVLQIIPAALIYGPILVLTIQVLRRGPGISDRQWFYIALAGWLAFQLAALSFARTGGTIQSRYADIFIIGIILNFAALLVLTAECAESKYRRFLAYGSALWIFAVMLGAGQKATVNVIDEVSFRYASGERQTENVKAFLATGDFSALDNKSTFDIPFPDAAMLRDWLSNPALRAILPAELRGVEQPWPLRDLVLSHGALLIPIGLALLLTATMTLLPGCGRRKGA